MRMQFREKLDFIYVVPRGNRRRTGDDAEGESEYKQGEVISTYGRLVMPVSSQMSFQQGTVDERTSAVYSVRYTKELEPILRSPQRWKVRPTRHYKLRGESSSILSVDLDYRSKMLEVRI